MKRLAVFTSICEEDKGWLTLYHYEMTRLGLEFALHFDRCSEATIEAGILHPLCIGYTRSHDSQDFDERHKQEVMDLVLQAGYEWIMPLDCDETFEKDAAHKINEILALDTLLVDIPWRSLWVDPWHHRTDSHFRNGHRVKFIRVWKDHDLRFLSGVVNGPSYTHGKQACDLPKDRIERYDLNCLHWGMMTANQRKFHQKRWDRIYSKLVGVNPYNFWIHANNPDIPPTIEQHDWLPDYPFLGDDPWWETDGLSPTLSTTYQPTVG